jgi:hypothetical protein
MPIFDSQTSVQRFHKTEIAEIQKQDMEREGERVREGKRERERERGREGERGRERGQSESRLSLTRSISRGHSYPEP